MADAPQDGFDLQVGGFDDEVELRRSVAGIRASMEDIREGRVVPFFETLRALAARYERQSAEARGDEGEARSARE